MPGFGIFALINLCNKYFPLALLILSLTWIVLDWKESDKKNSVAQMC